MINTLSKQVCVCCIWSFISSSYICEVYNFTALIVGNLIQYLKQLKENLYEFHLRHSFSKQYPEFDAEINAQGLD
ncbi:hypothetical protein BpHYR1_046221 [Brachionus plicatilis]|uniref:Uncharacterized protein n=1 Tax=Brachionus plicatilis TaxID=10195 RepID=A0A3M7SMY5_BRAPC|nr:hypothetical protein BpHYR1_046221 [Brachionus plicatilis]